MSISRRLFLSTLAASSPAAPKLAATLAGIGALAAHAQTGAGADYQALVCLFMAGGNDSHNWVVPMDLAGHAEYARSRGALALPLSVLQPLSAAPRQAAGRAFGMPGDLAPLRELYESGRLAAVANVGPLERPVTKADFELGRNLPPKLFSHNDQAAHWQSMGPEGTRAGWGGRIADAVQSLNGQPLFTSVSVGGNALFAARASGSTYVVGTNGPIPISAMTIGGTLGSTTLSAALRQSLFNPGTSPFQADVASAYRRSVDAHAVLAAALAGVSVPELPTTPQSLSTGGVLRLDQLSLPRQLRVVAQMVAAGRALGMKRQVFMVTVGGFDTHGNQLRDHPALMGTVAGGIGWFTAAMNSMGLGPNVTLFTASDFGRTLSSNGSGSDHGWGSHHFVAGGAVRGRDVYGRFPVTALGSADDVGSGRLLPSTSVTEYAATLATWMGVPASDLASVLPGIGQFGSTNLGFV